jgi:hypothetical protein
MCTVSCSVDATILSLIFWCIGLKDALDEPWIPKRPAYLSTVHKNRVPVNILK